MTTSDDAARATRMCIAPGCHCPAVYPGSLYCSAECKARANSTYGKLGIDPAKPGADRTVHVVVRDRQGFTEAGAIEFMHDYFHGVSLAAMPSDDELYGKAKRDENGQPIKEQRAAPQGRITYAVDDYAAIKRVLDARSSTPTCDAPKSNGALPALRVMKDGAYGYGFVNCVVCARPTEHNYAFCGCHDTSDANALGQRHWEDQLQDVIEAHRAAGTLPQ
jgi:hypothetical protein